MSSKFAKSLLAVAMLCLTTGLADAHPRLQSMSPTRDARLAVSPKQLTLKFSEGLIARFSGIDLQTNSGQPIPTGKPSLAPGDNKKLVVPLNTRLKPGAYRVKWHAVSVDTHRVTGSYGFRVIH